MNRAVPGLLPPRTESASDLVRRMVDELDETGVTVSDVVDTLGRRSFGGLILIVAALLVLPGISFVAAFALIFIALQMAVGRRQPFLPKAILRRRIPADTLRAYCNRVLRGIEFVERFVRPRWFAMTLPPMPMVLGLAIVSLALAALLPVPFIQLLPAVVLLCLSLGLMERDRVLIAIGLVLGAAAVAFCLGLSYAAIDAVWPVVDGYVE